ncbi:MAG: winged helix-turn-helix domain-containing protein [Rhizobiales bacterium]|nr:winged helix-turn-helix domain-containing protein [Hyphomicrobiales bacterium]
MLRFAGFELDFDRAELRKLDGEAIKLRPKTLALLHLFATNPGRVLSKQELMTAIWPNIHVGEDSLFQCIREIRTALHDESRQLVKSVSGRGYLFSTDVRESSPGDAAATPLPAAAQQPTEDDGVAEPTSAPRKQRAGRWWLLAAALIACVAVASYALSLLRHPAQPGTYSIAIAPLEARSSDPVTTTMAANIADHLTDGLSTIGNIRVIAPHAVTTSPPTDFILRGDLQRDTDKWVIQARLVEGASGQVRWSSSASVPLSVDPAIQQSRLTAGIGYPLALFINALSHSVQRSADSKIVIDQANAYNSKTTPERLSAARNMLEKALASHPNDVDLQASLAAHLIREVQMEWLTPEGAAAAESRARNLLESALEHEPDYVPVMQAYCRLLMTTNHFVESLVACQKTLVLQPWDGATLFHMGISQLQLGRIEDALASFKQADAFDMPAVSRWTWLLGAGVALVHLDRYEEALSWLNRSLAITPGTGRTSMLIAAAYQALGQPEKAREAMKEALKIRPRSNAINVPLRTKNESPRYLAGSDRIMKLLIAAGLPEK